MSPSGPSVKCEGFGNRGGRPVWGFVPQAVAAGWIWVAAAWCGALGCACMDLGKYHLDETRDAAESVPRGSEEPASEGGTSGDGVEGGVGVPPDDGAGGVPSGMEAGSAGDGRDAGGLGALRCPALSIANGTVAVSAQTIGGEARYSCGSGYALSGTDTRNCRVDATWAGSEPTCVIDCGLPATPSNGDVSAPLTTLGASATYTCKEGYYRRGVEARKCQVTGTWSDTTPSCDFVDCKAPASPTNGAVQTARTTYDAEAKYGCQDGYSLSGPASRTCQADGSWSGTAGTCVATDCGTLANPLRGKVQVTGTTFQSIATYTCTAPSVLSGSATRTCQANGAWSGSVPVCQPPKSCQGGQVGAGMKCGGPNGTDDCCASPLVEGGTFNRDNNKSYPATVSSFRLDKYEITVGRFRAFVAAGMGTKTSPPASGSGANPNVAGSGWDPSWNGSLEGTTADLASKVRCDPTYQTWTGNDDGRAMNCITWYEAFAFCIWDGGRLPTELEWSYAAAGGNEQRQYPWGSTAPDCTYANYYTGSANCGPGGTEAVAAVGSYVAGSGKWGQADLAGNVWEWNLDWLADSYPSSCNNCVNLSSASDRVIRGGCFRSEASTLLSSSSGVSVRLMSSRGNDPPSYRGHYSGARCSRTP